MRWPNTWRSSAAAAASRTRLLITNDIERTTEQLFARYAERMGIENELDAYISGFHLDALSSGLPLNVDLDTTLTVIAGNLHRLLARKLPPL